LHSEKGSADEGVGTTCRARASLPPNDPQDLKTIFGDPNARAAAEHVSAWDELEDPVIALIVHCHFVVLIDRVRGCASSGLESFEKWIQKQDHGKSTSSRFPATETLASTPIS
jgi:hypothetical protein